MDNFTDFKNQELYSNEGIDPEWELSEDQCPECNIYMHKSMEANGSDDYRYIWYCENCGNTESE